MKHVTLVRIALLAIATTASLSQTADDIVELQCPPGPPVQCPVGENGVLLVAKTKTLTFPPKSGSTVPLNIKVDEAYHQAVAFRADRAPAIETSSTWTPHPQTVKLKYPNIFELPLQVWVICPDSNCGPVTDNVKKKLRKFRYDANRVLHHERTGIKLIKAGLADAWIADEIQNTALAAYSNFSSSQCADLNDLAVMNGWKKTDALNLYVVRTVDLLPSNGYSCIQHLAVVGWSAYWTTMMHEIGHTFSLGDVDGHTITRYNPQENFMYSESPQPSDRRFFNEGQIFRIHFNADSSMNQDLGLRNLETRRCGHSNADAEKATPPCPPLGTWIWPDQ